MRILITGISGMLGVDLYQDLREEHEVVGLDTRDFPCVPFLPVKDHLNSIEK